MASNVTYENDTAVRKMFGRKAQVEKLNLKIAKCC